MLRKHVLSNYADIRLLDNFKEKKRIHKYTVITEQGEASDPDEMILGSSSFETSTTEVSDPDEMLLYSSQETRATEISDPDNFGLFVTRETFVVENSDTDEISLTPYN